jgi:hypothetical protein
MPSANHQNGRVRAVELTPAHLQLANWLLAQEMSDPADLPGVTDAAEHVLQKLLRRLAKLITPIGCQALLSRALHLSRADYPFLGELHAGVTDDAWLEGLHHSVESLDPLEARAGLAALLGTLIGLIMLFIGEDLTWRLFLELGWEVPMPVWKRS